MTFAALLAKELRSRLRRERAIWIIIVFLVVMGLLGIVFLQRANAFGSGNHVFLLSSVGIQLYLLFTFTELLWIVFIAPSFTATAINGEKERQTFDLLLCSRLSPLTLIAGKLIAGIANLLLLIAASIPLFSLVFFFGGIALPQVIITLVVLIVTAMLAGAIGICCSTLLHRPTISTAVAYAVCALWMFFYWILYYLLIEGAAGSNARVMAWMTWLGALNPLAVLTGIINGGAGTLTLVRLHMAPWVVYTLISVIATIVLFLISSAFVRPDSPERILLRVRVLGKKSAPAST